MSSLSLLETYLRTHHPDDVLIPCAAGEKRPLFVYGNAQWVWGNYDSFEKPEDASIDWAIILTDICVVDVDDPAVANDLEARFPILLSAPCERTKRGFHYFFKRSALAKRDNYWDSSGDLAKVDFKSVTSTGTGGIILVCPSTDKAWVRPPWVSGLIDIPDDLLMSVARPGELSKPMPSTGPSQPPPLVVEEKTAPETAQKAASIEVDPNCLQEALLEFDGEASMRVSGKPLQLMRQMDFFGPMLEGRWSVEGSDNVPTLKIPCQRATFEELLSFLEHGELTQERVPTEALLAAVYQAADMLGAPTRGKSVLLERSTFQADLYKINPAFWRVHRDEQACMLGTDAEKSDAALINIDAALARNLGYDGPPSKGALWLFEELPPLLDETKRSYKVLADDPQQDLLDSLPQAVVQILRRHSKCVAVAGGAVLGGVTRFVNHGSDVDLFFYGVDQASASAVLNDIDALLEESFNGLYDMSRSPAALTYTMKKEAKGQSTEKDSWLLERPFQVVLGLHRSRSQIVEYFDLAPSKALAHFEGDTVVVEALPAFVVSLRTMSFWVDTKYWSPSSVARPAVAPAGSHDCLAAPNSVQVSPFQAPFARRRASQSTLPRATSAPCPACAVTRSRRTVR